MADKVRMTSLMSIKRLGFGLKRVWTQTGLSSICSPAFPCCSLPHLPIGDRDAVLASVDQGQKQLPQSILVRTKNCVIWKLFLTHSRSLIDVHCLPLSSL